MQVKEQSTETEVAATNEVVPTEQTPVAAPVPAKPNAMEVIQHLLSNGWTHQDIRKKMGLNAHLMTRLFGMRISKHDNKKRVTETERKRKRKLQKQARQNMRRAARAKG